MDKLQKPIEMTVISSPIVARVRKLSTISTKWSGKMGRMISGNAQHHYYYETVQMSKDITRFYARSPIARKLDGDKEIKVMKWIKRKFLGPKSDWTIIREGSNFYDVISTETLSKL